MKKNRLKIIGYGAVLVLVLNIVLFAFTIITWQTFLIILGFAALFTYLILPKIKTP